MNKARKWRNGKRGCANCDNHSYEIGLFWAGDLCYAGENGVVFRGEETDKPCPDFQPKKEAPPCE